jgi:DNA-binding beta-propeller fold protein YncE
VGNNAARYPGCFIFVAIQQAGFENSLLVVSRTGEVGAKITPAIDQTQVNFFPTGLSYKNGHLLVGDVDGKLYEFDLDGNVVAGPIHFSDAADIEGVAYSPQTDRVAITSNSNGKLIFLDSYLNRQSIEKSYLAGLGLGNVLDVTWSNQTSEFLVNALSLEPTMNLPQIAAINSSVTASRMVVNLNSFPSPPTRLEYLGDSNEFAIFKRSPLPRGFELL